jgi:hypothetical protein
MLEQQAAKAVFFWQELLSCKLLVTPLMLVQNQVITRYYNSCKEQLYLKMTSYVLLLVQILED